MDTRLRAWSLGLLEALLLVVAGAVPLFVNYYGFRVFELGKAALLLSFALPIAVVAFMALLEGGGGAIGALGRALRRPLAVAALLLAIATALSTITARVPELALFGAPERLQGLLQVLAALTLFAAMAWVARSPNRRRRLVTGMVAFSIPVALYACTQALGLEAVPGRAEDTRVFGTLSNPIFLGAYLMLLAPIVVARIGQALRTDRLALAATWLVVLVLQVVALLLTASRGPILGLVAGLFVMALAGAAVRGQRGRGFAWVGVAVVALGLLGVSNVPGGPGEAMQDVPVLGRFATISALDEGSQAVRLRVWDAVARLVTEEPERLATGHGPESLRHALLPYGDTYLAGRAQADRIVDRSHSVPFDALAMTGLLGLVAQLAVWGAALYAGVVAVGLAPGRGDRRMLAGLLVVGPVVLGLAGWLARPGFAGAMMALGLLAGLGPYLLAALTGRRQPATPDPLALALLAVSAAAVTEGAFGIRTVATETTWWLLAGVLLALALPERDERGQERAAPRTRRELAAEKAGAQDDGVLRVGASFTRGGAAMGLAFGLVACLPIYSLWPASGPPTNATMPVLWLLVAATVGAAVLAAADAGEGVAGALLLALLLPATFTIVRALVLLGSGSPMALFTALVGWLLLGAFLAGAFLAAQAPAGRPAVGGVQAILYPLFGVGAVTAVVLWAIAPVRGDIIYQQALSQMQLAISTDNTAAFSRAEQLYEEAARLQPRDDGFHLRWGELYTTLGEQVPDLESAVPVYTRAQEVLGRAQSVDPELSTHTFNRGHLVLLFAERLAAQGADPTGAAADAQAQLEQAFATLHYEPQVANELALSRLLQGQVDRAIQELEYSRDVLDDENPQTYQLLSRAYQMAGRAADSEAALNRAMALGAEGDPSVLLQRADQSRQQGDLEAAVGLYEQAVNQLGTNVDWKVLYNLGLLYRDTGRPQQAVDALTQAMSFTGGDPQASDTIQAALMSLLNEDDAGPPEGFLESAPAP